MGWIQSLQDKAEQARAQERIRPLIESRMMRDILLEIGQRGTEKLDPQSVPVALRPRAAQLAAECGTAGLHQSVVSEVVLDEHGIVLTVSQGEQIAFLYADYNYEDIENTDCLLAVAQYLVQHLRGYYSISRTFYTVAKHKGHGTEEHIKQVFIRRHHEDTPFDPTPAQKQKLF